MTSPARITRGTALVAIMALVAGLIGAVAVEDSAFAAKVPAAPTNVVRARWRRGRRDEPDLGRSRGTSSMAPRSTTSSRPRPTVLRSVPAVATGQLQKATLPCAGVFTCSFRVYANTKVGGTGPASATATAPWSAPGPPTITTSVGGPNVGSMTVSWNPPANTGGKALNGYLYEVQVNSTGTWLGPFLLAGLPTAAWLPCGSTLPAGGCSYRISARNAVGTSAPSAVRPVSWGVPSAPVINSVTPGKPAQAATVNWRPGASTGGLATTYTYEVSADAGAVRRRVPGPSRLRPRSPRWSAPR